MFVQKHSFLKFFALFRLGGAGILSYKGEMGVVCMFQGQIDKISRQNLGKSNILVLALSFITP